MKAKGAGGVAKPALDSTRPPNGADDASSRKALEGFVNENPDLDRLEDLLDEFNIFEALGVVRQELRHSDFLAFLLDPVEAHGLGDAFLKRFLKMVVSSVPSGQLPVSAVDIDVWDMDDVEVRREWEHIDVLVLNPHTRLAVAIENKIDSGEHGRQLETYRMVLNNQFPGWKALGVYLTPEGDRPSDEFYTPISYKQVQGLLTTFLAARGPTMGPGVKVSIEHYVSILGKEIVGESEIVDLSRRIFKKHERALKVIFEHMPDRQSDIRQMLERMVDADDRLVKDQCSKSYIRFGVKAWDVPTLKEGSGWTPTKRIPLFEFGNFKEQPVKMKLFIGPGPDATRQRLYEMAKSAGTPLRVFYQKLNKKWDPIYERVYVTPKELEELTDQELTDRLEVQWQKFISEDFQAIDAAVRAQKWAGFP